MNQRGVDRALRDSHATLLTVNGTDLFGLYKKCQHQKCTKSERNRNHAQAHAAQRMRIGVRCLLISAAPPLRQQPSGSATDVDDDNQVNVTILRVELRRTQREAGCIPSCWIADVQVTDTNYGSTPYTQGLAQGGWCIERELAHRTNDLLHLQTSVAGLDEAPPFVVVAVVWARLCVCSASVDAQDCQFHSGLILR